MSRTWSRNNASLTESPASVKLTTDHDEIMDWVEERDGYPAMVSDVEESDEAGGLRIDFPGEGEELDLEHISWDEFFDKFDENGLAFLHQDFTADGEISRFSRFVDAEAAEMLEGLRGRGRNLVRALGARRGELAQSSQPSRSRNRTTQRSRAAGSRARAGGAARGGRGRVTARGRDVERRIGREMGRASGGRRVTRGGRGMRSERLGSVSRTRITTPRGVTITRSVRRGAASRGMAERGVTRAGRHAVTKAARGRVAERRGAGVRGVGARAGAARGAAAGRRGATGKNVSGSWDMGGYESEE